MKNRIHSFFIVFLFVTCILLAQKDDPVAIDSPRWKTAYLDVKPQSEVSKWLLPFQVEDRSDYKNMRIISVFGSHRNSYLKGHKHSGLDIIPRNNSDTVEILAMAEGAVCSIHLGDPHRTVVLRHKTKAGKEIFTSYKHLAEVFVRTGQQLDHESKIGRLYTKSEARRLGGNYDHLHLEIRKKFDDYGCASWLTLSKKELKKRFYDPEKFLKENLVLN